MRFSANNPVKTAWFLALAGFVPFAAMAMLMLASGKYHPFFPVIEDAFRTYSAIILSFLGGTRWGMALLGKTVSARVISFSVLPALCGWLALFLPAPVFNHNPAVGVLCTRRMGQHVHSRWRCARLVCTTAHHFDSAGRLCPFAGIYCGLLKSMPDRVRLSYKACRARSCGRKAGSG